MNNEGKINFSLGLDTSGLQKDVAKSRQIFKSLGDEVKDECSKMDDSLKKVGKAVAAYFTATQILSFGKAILNARKEIESFEISFNTLLGSKEKGAAFFAEIKEFAVKTPLQLNDIARAAQTLLGFGIEANRIMPILRQLGDVSMGNAERFKSLSLAFAQATSAGKLQGQDLLQMTNAGFNPLNEIAKKTGKSIGELKEDMAKGKISAQDLADALSSAASQGGQFYGMLEEQSKGIEGSLSNLEGAWQDALNEIGTSLQGTFTDAIALATKAIQNYDVFIKAILSLAAAYGTYKAVLMATVIIQKTQAFAENIRLIMMFRKELGLLNATQQAFNITAMKNPYIMLATAIAGVVTALVLFNKNEDQATEIIEKCNEQIKQQNAELEQLKNRKSAVVEAEKDATKSTAEEISKIELLINTIHDETNSLDDRRKAIRQMQAIVPKYHAELDNEGKLHRENTQAIDDHIDSLNRLALAKALQAKREELLAQKVNAEIDRRQAVTNKKNTEEEIKTAQQRVKKEQERYKQREKEIYDSTIESNNIFVSAAFGSQEGQMARAATLDAERTAIKVEEKGLKVAEKKLEVEKGAIALADRKIETLDKERAALDEIMKEYDKELLQTGTTFSGGGGSGNQGTVDNSLDGYNELLEKQKKEKERSAKDMEFEIEQARIDAMKSGSEKILAQMDLDHKKEVEELKREKEDYLQQKIDNEKAIFEADPVNKGKKFDASTVKLTDEEANAFEKLEELMATKQKNANQSLVAEQQRLMNEYLKDYGTYLEKRNAIIALYNEQIANATTEGEKQSLTKQMEEELSELDIDAFNTTNAISDLFGDMTDKTVADMRKIADTAQEVLSFIEGGEWNKEKGMSFGITEETFNTLKQTPEELEKIRKGIRDCNKEADSAEDAFGKMANGLKKLFEAGDNPDKLEDALGDIGEVMSEYIELAGFLSDTFSNLGDAFGGGFGEVMNGIGEGINIAMDAANSAMSGAQAGAMFGPWGAAAGAAIGLVSSLASSLSKLHDEGHEEKIQAINGQIDQLQKGYDALADAIEDAYSKDASRMIAQQEIMLRYQKYLIEQQIAEEEAKKDPDNERINNWKETLAEIDGQIADNKEKAIDAIFGEDLKSAIENFASAYTDAWAEGTSKAQSAKDIVKKMMRQMVTESIKAAIQSSKKMEEIRQKLQEFYADNILSGWEQDYIYQMAEELQDELDSQFGWADDLMNDSSSQEGSKRGFETMSQESADELNGRFTAVQMDTSAIRELMLAYSMRMIASINSIKYNTDEIRNLSLSAIGHLETISRNTFELYEMNERLGKIERNTRRL